MVKKGDTIEWKWGNGSADAKVEKVSADKTEVKSKGKKITRNGSEDNKAIVAKQSDGTKVVKKESEVKAK
ncbi:MAG: DUF2945 domain-containing protein [Candidatus Microsaccharimonas sp.]